MCAHVLKPASMCRAARARDNDHSRLEKRGGPKRSQPFVIQA
jgi:hypothetical protein